MVFKSQFQDVIPDEEYKDSLSLFYWKQLDKFAKRILFVDYVSGRQWTGAEIKRKASGVAQFLIDQIQLKPQQSCCLFYPNDDRAQITALGVLFAGGTVCSWFEGDPRHEHSYMLNLMQPGVVFCKPSLKQRMVELREENKLHFKICIIGSGSSLPVDDGMTFELPDILQSDLDTPDTSVSSNSSHSSGLEVSISSVSLPILVDPDTASYVLMTSGSTGLPKPVARSQRNSLYVCHCLSQEVQERLWNLDENSVLSGHLPLDHGTGIFCTKMTLSKGLKLIIMDNYEFDTLLTAVSRYQITDLIMGSAALHNLISTPRSELNKHNLSSLRNMMAAGSRLPSHAEAVKFMTDYPSVRLRQTLGLSEMGFTCLVERERAKEDNQTCGMLLPNVRIKLLDLNTGEEITEPDREGELYFSGPTRSPGYLAYDSCPHADRLREQSRKAFLEDGYYRSFDIGSFTRDHRLKMHGRINDILYLHGEWKVLPQEIESLLMTHPSVQEAAVVGIPHPKYGNCQASRAYVILREEWRERIVEQELIDFVAERTSEPKRLIGGLRFMDSLPRARLSKVDRRALLKLDGFSS